MLLGSGHQQKFACSVAVHSWPNCFGYAAGFRNGGRNGTHAPFLAAKHAPNAPLLGFFRVRPCEESSAVSFIQIFGTAPFSTLFVGSAFCRLCGLEEGQEVILEPIQVAAPCERVEISPVSTADYEIMESGSDSIEAGCLDQIRLVAPRMLIAVQLAPGMAATFRIESISPPPPAGRASLLMPSTELHVLATTRGTPSSASSSANARKDSRVRAAAAHALALRVSCRVTPSSSWRAHLSSSAPHPPLLLRVLPRCFVPRAARTLAHPGVIFTLHEDDNAHYASYNAVRLRARESHNNNGQQQQQNYALLVRLPRRGGSSLDARDAESERPSNDDLARSIRIALNARPSHVIHCLSSSSSSSTPFPFIEYERVLAEQVDESALAALSAVDVTASHAEDGERLTANAAEVSARLHSLFSAYPLLLPARGISYELPCQNGPSLRIQLAGAADEVRDRMRDVCFVAHEETTIRIKQHPEPESDANGKSEKEDSRKQSESDATPSATLPACFGATVEKRTIRLRLRWQRTLCAELLGWLRFTAATTSGGSSSGVCTLLAGSSGSGRSSVLRLLARDAHHAPETFYTAYVDCASWKGKQAETIEKQLASLTRALSRRAPSLLLLDDIDLVATAGGDEEQRVVAVERVFHVLWRLLLRGGRSSTSSAPSSGSASSSGSAPFSVLASSFSVVATARRLTSVHPALVSSGGRRFFDRVLQMPPLDQEARVEVLRAALLQKDGGGGEDEGEEEGGGGVEEAIDGASNVVAGDTNDGEGDATWEEALQQVGRQVENASLREMLQLSTRARVLAQQMNGDGSPTPSALVAAAADWRKKTNDSAGKAGGARVAARLDAVGGMTQQKAIFTEVMLWPHKYASLFSRCGVRLGGGLLLHGPSGCGKTLLAIAMVAESGYNLISVRGPELLSKYIGSSEENVRDVFQRARASAPCVIFFDELDALAPRRGSDTSGVADRVVNQMLTEMDGAEGLTGVFVLGATSRLDLIDEALIRPGRFDYSVHCGLPTREERREILRVLVNPLHIVDPPSLVSSTLSSLSSSTSGWSGADLRALTTNAFFRAAARAKDATVGSTRPEGREDDSERVDSERVDSERVSSDANDEVPLLMEDLLAVVDESAPRRRAKKQEEGDGGMPFRVGASTTLA